MRIPTRRRTTGISFNITPLIDIVFLLIIFFLVSTHFVQSETLSPVDLPSARKVTDDPDANPRRLVITINSQNRVTVANRPVELAEIEHMISEGRAQHGLGFEIRIRGDRSVPYEAIEPILIGCAKAGVSQVRFAVVKKDL